MQFDGGQNNQYDDESEFVRPYSRTGDYVIASYSCRSRVVLWRIFTINPVRDGVKSGKTWQKRPAVKTSTIWQHTLHSRTDSRSEIYREYSFSFVKLYV